jgi:hypothetical protein
MVSVQPIPERSIRSLRRLHAPLDRATGDGPALGQIFVIRHAKAIAVEIVRDDAQHLTLGPDDPAFGPALANPLDNLTDFATGFARCAVQNPEFSLQASFGVRRRTLPSRVFPESAIDSGPE